MLLDEAAIVRRRLDAELGSHAVLTKLALDATPNMNVKASATVKASKDFAKRIKSLFGV